jgi:hypothetical protein
MSAFTYVLLVLNFGSLVLICNSSTLPGFWFYITTFCIFTNLSNANIVRYQFSFIPCFITYHVRWRRSCSGGIYKLWKWNKRIKSYLYLPLFLLIILWWDLHLHSPSLWCQPTWWQARSCWRAPAWLSHRRRRGRRWRGSWWGRRRRRWSGSAAESSAGRNSQPKKT